VADTFGLTGRPFPGAATVALVERLAGQVVGPVSLALAAGAVAGQVRRGRPRRPVRFGGVACSLDTNFRRLLKDLLPWLGYLHLDGMQNASSLSQRNKARGRLPAAGHHLVDPGLVLDRGVTLWLPMLNRCRVSLIVTPKSGQFEVFSSPAGDYWFRLVDSSGATWATSSETFATKGAVAAAIALVREIAGTGLVRDQSTGHSGEPTQPRFRATQAAAIRIGSSNFLSGPGLSPLFGRISACARR